MKEYKDMNEKVLSVGDIIDIYQTVNGQSKFVILSIEPLDIRYFYNITRKYEYCKQSLLDVGLFGTSPDWGIIDNLYTIKNAICL